MTSGHAVHRYRATSAWHGSTAAGYDAYDRTHTVVTPGPTGELRLSGDPAFGGQASLRNPEQLLLAAASSCQLLSFLAVAARARVDVVDYRDEAEAEMPEAPGAMSLERIVLRPHITVAPGTDLGRLPRLVEVAHRECFIANSLRSEMAIEATFAVAGDYAFRDGDDATERLAMVARLFATPSRDFVTAAVADLPAPPQLAVDLGCGPGNTTALLEQVTGAAQVVGLDASEEFLAVARSHAGERSSYARHDLRRLPWPPVALGPGAGPDLAYGRLVLAHLPDPADLALAWLGQLAPGGRLLLDELEWIRTDDPVLHHYLELVTALVAAHGTDMFAGPLVAALDPGATGRVVSSKVRRWPVAVVDAAAMFALNLSVWRSDPAVAELVAGPTELDRLARDLRRVAEHGARGQIRWGLRQVVLERAG